MHFECVHPILQLIGCLQRFSRELAGLAYENKASVQLIGERRSKNETTSFHPDNPIYMTSDIPIRQQINGHVKSLRIPQKRRNVLKHNPFFREVLYIANLCCQGLDHVCNPCWRLTHRVALDLYLCSSAA